MREKSKIAPQFRADIKKAGMILSNYKFILKKMLDNLKGFKMNK